MQLTELDPCLGEDTAFEPNELRNYLRPVWEKLDRSDDAIPFRAPVDPQLLGIPDYLDIVKKPMDLSTICNKLDLGEYKNAWEFCDDMWLMFDNAWLYNRKNSKVYKYSTKVSAVCSFRIPDELLDCWIWNKYEERPSSIGHPVFA